MDKPKACTCGGLYKKVAVSTDKRDGSRYFKCNKCGAKIEQTSNGYEFRDAAPPPPVVVAPAPTATLPPETRGRAW